MNDYDGKMPKKYIVYQLEQTGQDNLSTKDGTNNWFNKSYIKKLKSATSVWDYSLRNVQNLKSYGIHAMYVPLIYMSTLDTIPRLPEQEKTIDVLFYGSINQRRKKIYQDFMSMGVKAEFYWNNLWTDELKEKISKAKIVLNIHFYPNPILETSRLSYLIGNGAFVISEHSKDPILDRDYGQYVVWADYDYLVETSIKYIPCKKMIALIRHLKRMISL